MSKWVSLPELRLELDRLSFVIVVVGFVLCVYVCVFCFSGKSTVVQAWKVRRLERGTGRKAIGSLNGGNRAASVRHWLGLP